MNKDGGGGGAVGFLESRVSTNPICVPAFHSRAAVSSTIRSVTKCVWGVLCSPGGGTPHTEGENSAPL